MYIVSGCPRSGTSLMMDLLRVALGDDRILGKKFPQEEQIEKIQEKREDETEEEYAARMYVFEKTNEKKDILKELEESKDMNPNGFWEMLYTVSGCHYRFFDEDRLNEILNEENKPFVCKIVSQGLVGTDPRYITKIIYMLRHPRSVAKSQERLKRNFPFSEDGKFRVNGEEVKIHTPEMFINVTLMASRYLLKHPDIPVLHVQFEELVEKPYETLEAIGNFLGEGDIKAASDRIESRLQRSQPENIDSPFWEDAEFVYDKFVKKDYQAVIDYLQDPSRMIRRKNKRWVCTRMMVPKVEDECELCLKDAVVRHNHMKTAENKGIDWENEPCIYECAHRCGYPHKSIEESIQENHWLYLPDNQKKEVSTVHPAIDNFSNDEGITNRDYKRMGPSTTSPLGD